jgi:hypothetical protein
MPSRACRPAALVDRGAAPAKSPNPPLSFSGKDDAICHTRAQRRPTATDRAASAPPPDPEAAHPPRRGAHRDHGCALPAGIHTHTRARARTHTHTHTHDMRCSLTPRARRPAALPARHLQQHARWRLGEGGMAAWRGNRRTVESPCRQYGDPSRCRCCCISSDTGPSRPPHGDPSRCRCCCDWSDGVRWQPESTSGAASRINRSNDKSFSDDLAPPLLAGLFQPLRLVGRLSLADVTLSLPRPRGLSDSVQYGVILQGCHISRAVWRDIAGLQRAA